MHLNAIGELDQCMSIIELKNNNKEYGKRHLIKANVNLHQVARRGDCSSVLQRSV